jgi:predicted RNase H-like HicB family nuclease
MKRFKAKVTVQVDWDKNFGACVDGVCCVATGQTLSEVKERISYSLPLHLESMREDGDEIPLPLRGEYELVFSLSTQALIKAAEAATCAARANTQRNSKELLTVGV